MDNSELYLTKSNLDNVYSQVKDEISRRTNKDIGRNQSYYKQFEQMAKLVYNKIPENDRNLAKLNSTLVEKTVSYLQNKMSNRSMNPVNKVGMGNGNLVTDNNCPTGQNMYPPVDNGLTSGEYGFTMIKDNEDLNNKFNEMMASRATVGSVASMVGDGATASYMPQPNVRSQQARNMGDPSNVSQTYSNQFAKINQNVNPESNNSFTIKPFSINEDLMDGLVGSENVDSPLYQNIERLQSMENSNPMEMMEEYQKKRNKQIEEYNNIEKRQNITAMKTVPILENNPFLSRNNTDAITRIDQTVIDPMKLLNDGEKLTQKFMDRIEERIVNNNNANTINPLYNDKLQNEMVQLQRDAQPAYIEKVHYINVNSVDRNWETNAENRFQFHVRFNQNSTSTGANISQLFKNIISVELVNAILPMDESLIPFDNRLYFGISKYPYLLLRIDELDGVFRGTNNYADRAFSTLIYDKVFFTNVLSTEYISDATSSIVTSTPKQGFASEYMRGFIKYNPAYFEKKKYYNNPLASLNKMTITLTDPRGQYINNQSDVLQLSNIAFTTSNLAALTGTELLPSQSWPYDNQNARKYVEITTSTYFSNRLFRVGDRILIRNFNLNNAGANNAKFESFINRDQGHVIINLQLETNGVTNTYNKGFLNKIYIAPPGDLDTLNQTVDPATYYDSGIVYTDATYGTLINVDLQSHLMFRIVTREVDAGKTINSINVY